MDFDLFQSDDDDDILSAAYLAATQEHNAIENEQTNDVIPEFHCNGEDSTKSDYSADGFIKNNFTTQYLTQNVCNSAIAELTFSDYGFRPAQLNGRSVTQFVFGEACKNVQYLLLSVRGCHKPSHEQQQQTYYQSRRQVTQLYHLLLESAHTQQSSLMRGHVTRLRRLLNSVLDAHTWQHIYFANSGKGNECNVPAYHLLHGALEWRLLDLCLLHKYESVLETNSETDQATPSDFEAQLGRTFDDLVLCSVYHYVKKRTTDLLSVTAFACTCIKELWHILQQCMPKWATSCAQTTEQPTFWLYFNQAIERLKTKLGQYSLSHLDFCQFTNWLLCSCARLYVGSHMPRNMLAYGDESTENYALCDTCTQQFLNGSPSEEQLRVYICILTPVLRQCWRPRALIVTQLWEYHQKRLNSSYYITGATPAQLAVACASGRTYLEKYRALLAKTQPDVNLSSYTLHVLLLGKTVQELRNSGSSGANQTKKLLGRIYSKFSAQKFLTLNETGIHHLIELFLVLCLCGDIDTLLPNLREQLLTLDYEKLPPNRQLAVAKGHMALLILHAEQHWNMRDYIGRLVQQLAAVRNDLALSRIYADTLLDIFTHADAVGMDEHLLIDAWLPNFLNNSTPVEQERALTALHLIFEKLEQRTTGADAGIESQLLQALNEHVLPLLRLQFTNGYSTWLAQLAADFCRHAPDQQTFKKLFDYFIGTGATQPANRETQPQFLLLVLASTRAKQVPPVAVLQVWLRSLVLLGAQHKLVTDLMQHAIQLPAFHFLTTPLSAAELVAAKEPLCSFIAAVGKRYEQCSAHADRVQLADRLNVLLRDFELWLPMAECKLEKSELTSRYYSFLAIVIYNCAQLVYVKSKPSCFFHIAMTRFLLPPSIQMGKPPEPSRLSQLMHKIWPVLIQGIGRLNYKSDAYVNKTLNDLIQKWTPHFKISSNARLVARPFIACIQCDNQELAQFVFERLTCMFLATQRRQSDPHACLVITIFQEVVSIIAASNDHDASNEQRLLTFMQATTFPMLEHIMMVDDIVPSRGMLLTLFRTLTQCSTFQQSARLCALLNTQLRQLTKKHLAYYTFFYFELLMRFAQFAPSVLLTLMDFLQTEMVVVEAKRGAGEDARIRGCLRKLQRAIEMQLSAQTTELG